MLTQLLRPKPGAKGQHLPARAHTRLCSDFQKIAAGDGGSVRQRGPSPPPPWCDACFEPLQDPDGGPLPAYPSGKTWDEPSGKTGSGKKFFHNIIDGSKVFRFFCRVGVKYQMRLMGLVPAHVHSWDPQRLPQCRYLQYPVFSLRIWDWKVQSTRRWKSNLKQYFKTMFVS